MTIDPDSNFLIDLEIETRRRRRTGERRVAPVDWETWCHTLFPSYFGAPFSLRHKELWEWAETIRIDNNVPAFIGIWARGGAKSTNAEGIVVRLGAEERRKYVLYVSSTQDKADSHVSSIASMIESSEFSTYYHKMASRAVGKFGNVRGWRRERLHSANGFVVDAFGLDAGLRGIKIDAQRPDVIVLDDIDEEFDSYAKTQKKLRVITDTVLPAGSMNCAVLFIQNLIAPDSVASMLVDGRADALRKRIMSGPHPAIEDLEYENQGGLFVITGGVATWEGQSIEMCQILIDRIGISAFLREAQHEVENEGGIWEKIEWQRISIDDLPVMKKVVVWVDPAITETDNSDSQGISCGGITIDGTMVGLYWWEGIDSPEDALEKAIYVGWQWGAVHVGVETDQGGLTWKSVFKLAAAKVLIRIQNEWLNDHRDKSEHDMPPFDLPKYAEAKAGAGEGPKIERNQRLLTAYETGKVKHLIGTHMVIEKALKRFPKKPLDVADAHYWTYLDLIGKIKRKAGAWGKRH
jgi:hypothetical protein